MGEGGDDDESWWDETATPRDKRRDEWWDDDPEPARVGEPARASTASSWPVLGAPAGSPGTSEQPVAPAPGDAAPRPRRRGSRRRRVKVVAAALGSAIAIAGGVVEVVGYLQDHAGPPQFSGDLTSLQSASNFADFLADHDEQTVLLDIECGEADSHYNIDRLDPSSRCFFAENSDDYGPVRELGAVFSGPHTAQQVWTEPIPDADAETGVSSFEIQIDDARSDATMATGNKDAWLVIKGPFTISKSTGLSGILARSQQYVLRGVSLSDAAHK